MFMRLALVVTVDDVFEIRREDATVEAFIYPDEITKESALKEAETWGIPAERVYFE